MNENLDRVKRIIKKASSLEKDDDLSIAQEFVNIEDKIDEVTSNIELLGSIMDDKISTISEELKKKLEFDLQINPDDIRGEKGETGERGTDGKNYILTEKDKQDISSKIEPTIVEKVIERTEVIKEIPVITQIAISDSPETIVDKINSLPSDEEWQIDFSHIKNFPKIKFRNDNLHVTSSRLLDALQDVNLSNLTRDANGRYILGAPSTGGAWGSITGTLSDQTDLQTALNGKQSALSGTGFVKISGSTISYDNSTYYLASNPNGYTSNAGTVTSVSGTNNRITIGTGTTTPVIDISASYIGQASITTLGTISTGVWQGTAIAPSFMTTMTATVGGTVPTPPNNTTTFLRGDGTFATPAGGGLTVGTTTIASGATTRILYDNAGVLGEYTLTGTGTVVAMQTAPTFITSITDPLVIGGNAVGSSLSLQSTSGAGTTDFIKFLVGNNGATEAMRILHNGSVSIGSSSTSSTLNIIGVNSSTNSRVLNILGGIGITGTVTGQDISIVSGAGKEYDTGSASVGAGGGFTIRGGGGGGLNDFTVTAGTYTAGLGGPITSQGGAGGGVLDDPFDATVTLKGAAGGGLLYVGGDGGDASLGNSPSHSVGGKGGIMQFTTGFGASSQSKTTTIGGDSGSMIFSSNPAGNSGGRAGFTSSLAGSSGGYTISIGPGGTSTHSGSPNAAATMTGGNSGAFALTQSNAGNATTTAVFGNAAGTILGGTALNATIKLGDGGNATGGTVSNIGGNGSGLVVTFGKGGTGATANGTDGDGVFKDGYGNTVMTLKGNNTGFVNIPILTASKFVSTDASKNLVSTSGTLPTAAGSFSGVGTATTTFTVTIGATMANTTYKVNATPTNLLSAAVFYVNNKTTTTFDVVYLAGLTGTVTFDWSVFP